MWYDGLFSIFLFGGNIGKTNKMKLASYKNAVTWQNVFVRLLQDALHRYKIVNLPDTVQQRVILQSLLWYGNIVFFEKMGNILALPGAPSSAGYNINGDPGSSWVFSRNGQFNEEVKLYLPGEDESNFLKKTNGIEDGGKYRGVIVWENSIRYPFINQIVWFADMIADSMRTIDVARQNLKNPFVVVCEESVVNTVRKFFEKVDNNEERIINSGVFPVDKISVLPIHQETQTLSDATELVEWYENKFREICGIDSNAQQDKKGENLITAELSINDEYQEQSIDKCVQYIQEGLDNVNKIFGLNMKVEVNKDEYTDKNENILTNKNRANDIPVNN